MERDETQPPPASVRLTQLAAQAFAERDVGVTRFYSAAQVGQRIDRRVEIWRDESITTRDLCKIGETWYLIVQTEQMEDEDGIRVTRLSLEATDGAVWEAASGGHQG